MKASRFEFDAEGLLAVCVQHEMDHLVGKVFVEYLSPLKRDRIKTRMLKKAREEMKGLTLEGRLRRHARVRQDRAGALACRSASRSRWC